MKTFLFILSLSLSLSTTHSQTWTRQNPFPKLSQLYDVNFDGDIGLAVGSEGVIFTTTDGGLTWISRTAPPSATDITTAFVIPGTNGQTMLCGGNYLFISKDGGVTWSVTNNDLRNLFKIDQLPDGQWLAMGSEYGARSNNEGGFWDPFNYKGGNVTAGDFTTPKNGWIQFGGFGDNQVWVTTDGGLNWSLRDTTHFVNIIELDMLDDTIGFLSTEGNVFKTTDGGYHWNSLGGIASTSITDLHVVNGVDLWACLNNGDVYYSVTGGGGWTEYNPNLIPVNSSKGIYADESGRVWMAGNYVSILNSQDYGLNWRDQIPNYKGILVQPYFYNELFGIVAGSGGVVLKTTNSGTNWTEMHFPKEDHFIGAMMLSDQIMVIASSRGQVYYSNDQGITWDTIGTNLGQITDIYALNPLHILAVTEEGIIYKTNDHGLHWDIVYDNGGNPLAGLDFYNNQYGWASGINGEIVTSDNQGDSWTLQPTPGNGSFSDIVFTTRNEGWACSSSLTDSLWFTLDGGQSWQTTMLPLKRFWREMSFNNPDTGWIAGGVAGDGVVLRTNDRGLTWTEDHHSPAMLLGIYAV
ncbi:MAG TPA: YCF48-related protein, partial [Saprospiraceae bacterium]|nr:YCF48-related protein [Saprospiraceae bacterium]